MAVAESTVAAKKSRCRWFQFRLRTLLVSVLLVGIGMSGYRVWSGRVRQREAALARQAQALAEFNRGAALMEQYRYDDAAAAFETVLGLAPDWIPAQFNLGLAYLQLGDTTDDATLAPVAFERILQSDPVHPYAHYCLGLDFEHRGQPEEALEHYRAVHEIDPDDRYVSYKCAEVLILLDQGDEATNILEKLVADDPGFISAVYRLALQYKDMGRRDEARRLIDRFTDLNAVELTLGSHAINVVYGMQGKYCMVLGTDGLPLMRSRQFFSPRLAFSPNLKYLDRPTLAWRSDRGTVAAPGIAAEDVDLDGDFDLCLTGLDQQGRTALYLNNGSGGFSSGPTIANLGVCPCCADVDDDGDLDLWLGRAGRDLLLENDGLGNFLKATANDSLCGADELTTCARLVDLDSDGDIDLLACRLKRGSLPASGDLTPSAVSLYNNNGNGSFADIADQIGLAFRDTPIATAICDDFDNDWDMDIILCPADGAPPIAWVNDRVGKYRILDAASTGLTVRDVVGVTSADLDSDGDSDLLVFSKQGIELLVNQGTFSFRIDKTFSDRFGRLGGTGGQFADMDNDGDLDLVIADARRANGTRGPVLLVNDGTGDHPFGIARTKPRNLFQNISFPGNASCVVADFTGNGACDVFLAPAGEKPFLIENVTPGGHWIELDLIGRHSASDVTRSSHSAIGAHVEIHSGALTHTSVVGVPSGPVAMPPLRVHTGLGPNTQVEWLRIRWPDAQLQSELGISADQVLPITETQRKSSSCPHLFAWDGSRYQFVSDFGGVGGLGYWLAPGVYNQPDPTEYVRIPRLEPQGGEYVVQVVESLQEVVYFDEAKLVAVDHPEGTTVFPKEMMAVGTCPPSFEIFCIRQPIDPVRAVDHRGKDVTEEILHIDRRYAGATDPDDRFTGFAGDHFVELDFGDRLGQLAPDCRLVLFLYGSVEYPYSSTNYAASQAGVRARAPSIHVLRDGRWIELFHEVGYPAGVQHMMTLDVTGRLRPTDRTIRISSNMEVYWDRVFLAPNLADASLSVTEIAATSAEFHFLGYPREYSPDGRRPCLYDYNDITPMETWKSMEGDHTRFGDVTALLDEADDCFVIMGHGEEVTLRFSSDAFGPTPPGHRRTFILKTDSFSKDMDLYTAYPHTVEPLPFHAMSGYPYGTDEQYPDNERTRQYRRQYNTRHVQPIPSRIPGI